MNINIIITEEQKRILIKESIKSKMGDVVKSNYEFTKKIIGETIQTTGINLEFMLTWGASIGGFMVPINEYLKSGSVEISDMDLSLVLTSIMATLYLENKTTIKITFSKVSNMLAYSFIVPILPMLYDIESTETQAIVERLLSFGLITISSIVLRDLISKIIKRFNPNQ